MAPRWYAARTEPRTEFLAADELTRDGIQVFFPRVKLPQPRTNQAYIPLFPGYLFLRCDPEAERWPSFRPAHRIIGWVRFGGEIPWLPDEVIEALMEQSEAINRQGGLWRRFQAGEKVQVVSGHLEGLAEVVKDAKSPQARVQVLLEFMGRLVKAHVPWENLRPVEEREIVRSTAPRRTRGRNRWVKEFRPAAGVAV